MEWFVGDNSNAEPPAQGPDGDIADIFGLLDGMNPGFDWRKEREDAWADSEGSNPTTPSTNP